MILSIRKVFLHTQGDLKVQFKKLFSNKRKNKEQWLDVWTVVELEKCLSTWGRIVYIILTNQREREREREVKLNTLLILLPV